MSYLFFNEYKNFIFNFNYYWLLKNITDYFSTYV